MTRDELLARYEAGERDFRGANLASAVLRGEDLRRADLQSAILRGADLWHADLRGALLWSANLRDANMTGVDLEGASLCGADLRWANLGGAYLGRANLTDADLTEARLAGADLRDAVVDWPAGWSTDTRIRCRECQCGKTEAGYTDARVVLASQVGETVHIIHEGNCWMLTVSLAEAAEMRQEVER